MTLIFWSLAALVGWAYVGYPLAMIAWARIRPLPVRVAPGTPPLSVVLAVRNEEGRLARRVADLLAQDYPSDRLQIVIVCNGCTDGTEARARALAAERPGTIDALVSPAEGGKAEALNRGVAAARGEIVVFADARQTFERDVFRTLAAWLGDPMVGAVSGRLAIGRADDGAVEGVRRYWRMEVALRRAESRTGSVVGATGAIYAIRRALYRPLPAGLILDDVLTPMRIALAGHRVAFADGAVAHDEAAPDSASEFRRKVRTMVGNLELMRVEPRLLVPGVNPLFLRFLSHKLLRLAAPLCLIGMLAAGLLAGGPLYVGLVTIQIAFYALGAVGLLLPVPGLGIPAGFLLAHGAVLAALLRPRRGAESVWAVPRPE